jgi:succinate-semialdehyde dehydrogenase / glutarate-semialdehyde dehydrogenase
MVPRRTLATVESRNPATGEVLERFTETSDAELDAILKQAEYAFLDWRKRSLAERAKPLREAARLLRDKKTTYARAMALEMGKPTLQGEGEAEKCAWVCDYYADNIELFLSEQARETDATRSYVRFDPLGLVLAVMPWNFPFWQVFRFAAPTLAAGNAAILKHASNVPRCALLIEELLREANFPEGLFRTVLVGTDRVGDLLRDRRIRAATLTGSDRAGVHIAETAGHELKKTVLELGGSDPFIVLRDADVATAARTAAAARLQNSGQSCIAAKRFILEEPIADDFMETFTREMATPRMGDPLSRETEIGPQARHDLRDALHRQVRRSVEGGARLVLGGEVPPGPGAFYPATILTSVARGMPAFDEETFGPVAAVMRVKDAREAIGVANDTTFGLGASLWTSDETRARALAADIEAGMVFVNGLVKSDPRLPFGGIKRSGYGRELSQYAIREFVNIKSVWIR